MVALIIVVALRMFFSLKAGAAVFFVIAGCVLILKIVVCIFLGMFIYIGFGRFDCVMRKVSFMICGSFSICLIR